MSTIFFQEGCRTFKTSDHTMILKAATFGASMHKHQRRKGDNSSYICHPLEVAEILSDCHVSDSEVLTAAILHDTIEDTPANPEDILKLFGKRVLRLVLDVTDDKSLSKLTRKKLQTDHTRSSTMSSDAKLIKIADKIHNCSDLLKVPPQGWSREDITNYFVWSYEVIEPCLYLNHLLKTRFMKLYQSTFENGERVAPDDEIERAMILERYYSLLV